MTQADIKNELVEAWSALEPPAFNDLCPKHWGDYGECEDAFKGFKWKDVSYDMAMTNRQCLGFFTSEAALYFLPAFIVASFEEINKRQVLFDITDYALDGIRRLLDHAEGSGVLFSDPQRFAVRHYLEWLMEGVDADSPRADVATVLKLLDDRPAVGG